MSFRVASWSCDVSVLNLAGSVWFSDFVHISRRWWRCRWPFDYTDEWFVFWLPWFWISIKRWEVHGNEWTRQPLFMAWRNLSKVRRLNQDCGNHALQLSSGLVIFLQQVLTWLVNRFSTRHISGIVSGFNLFLWSHQYCFHELHFALYFTLTGAHAVTNGIQS